MQPLVLKLGSVSLENGDTRRIPHNGTNARMHWSDRKAWNDAWYTEIKFQWLSVPWADRPKVPLERPKVTITFFAVRKFDRDGAHSAAKPLLDGLRYANILKDDDEEHVDLQPIEQISVPSRESEHVEITIQTQ